MCHSGCIEYGRRVLSRADVEGKAVLEVGSMNLNGSLRADVERLAPARYLGVDLAAGPGVDEVCDIGGLAARFGEESFDLVLSTEVLEHVLDWKGAVSNLKHLVRPGGVLLVSTRSRGFHYHAYPVDYWRYEVEDARRIFGDFTLESCERDPRSPGIFVKARRGAGWRERDLSGEQLYSVITGRRTAELSPGDLARFRRIYSWRRWIPKPLRSLVLPLEAC